jgi:hypothetical protein
MMDVPLAPPYRRHLIDLARDAAVGERAKRGAIDGKR